MSKLYCEFGLPVTDLENPFLDIPTEYLPLASYNPSLLTLPSDGGEHYFTTLELPYSEDPYFTDNVPHFFNFLGVTQIIEINPFDNSDYLDAVYYWRLSQYYNDLKIPFPIFADPFELVSEPVVVTTTQHTFITDRRHVGMDSFSHNCDSRSYELYLALWLMKLEKERDAPYIDTLNITIPCGVHYVWPDEIIKIGYRKIQEHLEEVCNTTMAKSIAACKDRFRHKEKHPILFVYLPRAIN